MTIVIGSKLQVYNGTATQTSGGLTKKDIVRVVDNDMVRYKSKKQQVNGAKPNKKSQKARAEWTKATKKAYKYLQSVHDDEKGIKKVTQSIADKFLSSFISMKKSSLDKKKPSLNERLYIVTKLFFENKM